jgi:adenine-specific DNA-methyltransferase
MNPDLAMGEDLLKKTGSGNLFMIFGEPDIQPVDPKTGQIKPGTDGKIQIELMGLDIYDPTTGQIRSNSTADIACWFIDTNYNGESFFVRHAYFTGRDKPYEKLQRALKAEVDEAGLGGTVLDPEPPVRPTGDWQDRREGDQPLRG